MDTQWQRGKHEWILRAALCPSATSAILHACQPTHVTTAILLAEQQLSNASRGTYRAACGSILLQGRGCQLQHSIVQLTTCEGTDERALLNTPACRLGSLRAAAPITHRNQHKTARPRRVGTTRCVHVQHTSGNTCQTTLCHSHCHGLCHDCCMPSKKLQLICLNTAQHAPTYKRAHSSSTGLTNNTALTASALMASSSASG